MDIFYLKAENGLLSPLPLFLFSLCFCFFPLPPSLSPFVFVSMSHSVQSLLEEKRE